MEPIVTAYVAGAASALVAVSPLAVSAVAVLRWSLRRCDRVQRDCDEWRQAAANATVVARVMEARGGDPKDPNDDSGDDWKHGG